MARGTKERFAKFSSLAAVLDGPTSTQLAEINASACTICRKTIGEHSDAALFECGKGKRAARAAVLP